MTKNNRQMANYLTTRLAYWVVFGFGLLVFSGVANAALDISDIGVGARPLGMGKAYIALADDASAIFLNPAGLASNKNLNLLSMSGSMLGDVNFLVFGAADESPLGKFGIGFVNASLGGIPITTVTGTGSTAAISQTGITDYNSSQLVFSYGSKLSRFLKNGVGNNISLGGSIKYFLQGFSGGGTALQEAVGGGMDADLGLMVEANRWANFGLTCQNFLPVSFGGKFVWQKNSVVEAIPMVIKVGGSFSLLGPSSLISNSVQSLNLTVDYENMRSQNRPAVMHLGLEYSPLEALTLRTGLDQKPKATSAGVSVDNNLTAGVGLALAGFTFDYAFHQYGDISENVTHFFSIGYRGMEPEKERAKRRAEKKKSAIPQPEIVPKPSLKTFPDVPDNYWARKPIEYLATLKFMGGNESGNFEPTKEIGRGEMAVLLIKAKGFEVELTPKIKFNDVPEQEEQAPYISMAVEHKYITGYPGGSFKPAQTITRAEMAVIISKFAGIYVKKKTSKKVFSDVSKSHWAAPAIAAAKENGFFDYLADRNFGPDMNLTRAEAAEIISKTPFAKKQIEKLITSLSE